MRRRSFFGAMVGAMAGALIKPPTAPPLLTASIEVEWVRLASDPSAWVGKRIMLLPTGVMTMQEVMNLERTDVIRRPLAREIT